MDNLCKIPFNGIKEEVADNFGKADTTVHQTLWTEMDDSLQIPLMGPKEIQQTILIMQILQVIKIWRQKLIMH